MRELKGKRDKMVMRDLMHQILLFLPNTFLLILNY